MQATKSKSKLVCSVILVAVVLLMPCTLRAQATDPGLVNSIHKVLKNCAFHEITEEMFNTVAEDERYQHVPEMANIRKIRYLIFVECPQDRQGFYDEFLAVANVKDFSVMIRSKSTNEQFTFFRKKRGDMYEYLLLHDEGLSYIVTSLKISTLNELSAVMEMAGSISGG